MKELALRLMNLHLEPERIDIDTPPPSPVSFTNDSFNSVEVQVVSSSKRMKKGGVGRHSKRCKLKNPILNCKQVPDEFVGDHCDFSNEPPLDELCCEEELVGGYASYVADVADQVAGFHPLSRELFVVQGWDNKSSCTKVSLWLRFIIF